MRVLHVIPSLAARTGGPPVAVVESSLALRKRGVDCEVVATDMGHAASSPTHSRIDAADLPAGAVELRVRLFPARPPRRFAFSPSLQRALGEAVPRFDAVHIHSLYLFPQLAASLAARRAGVPYVISPRGALDPALRRRNSATKAVADALWQRNMLSQAAAIHCTSAEEARLIDGVALAVPRTVVPNGISCDTYEHLPSPSVFRARYLAGDDAPIVLYLGRLSHKKGLDVLIRAFALVRCSVPSARLVVAGPDDERLRPRLLALARQLGVSDSVTFTGMLRGDDKLSALAAASVWALPSRTENFGIAVVEAMAAGLPVVVSRGVNIAPEIDEADAGLVTGATPHAFASALTAVLREELDRTGLAARARAFARRYDWAEVAPQLESMYRQVAA